MKKVSKRKIKIKGLVAAISVSIFGAGCSNSSSSAGSAVSFKMTAANKAVSVAMKPSIFDLLMPKAFALTPSTIVDSTGLNISLTQSWVVIKEVEFEATETKGSSEVDGTEIAFRGPYYVDLLSSAPVTLDSQPLPTTAFQRIKMKLDTSNGSSALPSGAPAGLANNSIYLEGTIGSGGSSVAFGYQSSDDTEINIGGASAVTPSAGAEVLVEINFSNVFKQINMSSVTNNEIISSSNRHAGTSLCNSIDPSAHDIYTCIRKGLEKQANVGEDSDHNGSLDSDEGKVK